MRIGIMNNKGGTGKTTLATNIGHQLKILGKKVLLIDADPQKSAVNWHNANGGAILPVIGIDTPTIGKDIASISNGYDIVLIDCPSRLVDRSARINQLSIAILKCVDAVLIPLQPSEYDKWSTIDILEIIQEVQQTTGKPKAALIATRQIKNTTLAKKFRPILDDSGFPVFKSGTYNRIVYAGSVTGGHTVIDSDTVGDARREIEEITDELLEFIK